jgi:hypothetical protein
VSGKVTWWAWEKLLTEDAAWLRTLPRTLERDHVIAIIEQLAKHQGTGSYAFYLAQPDPHAATQEKP